MSTLKRIAAMKSKFSAGPVAMWLASEASGSVPAELSVTFASYDGISSSGGLLFGSFASSGTSITVLLLSSSGVASLSVVSDVVQEALSSVVVFALSLDVVDPATFFGV